MLPFSSGSVSNFNHFTGMATFFETKRITYILQFNLQIFFDLREDANKRYIEGALHLLFGFIFFTLK